MTPPNFPDRDDPAAPASPIGRPRVLVVGAGAIGGVVAAKLARAGHDVTALDANREHVARLTSPGLRLDELGTPFVVPVPAVAGMADLGGPGVAAITGPGRPGLTYGQVAAEPPGEWLAYRLWTEGYDVACATGVRPGEVAGIRPADLAVHTDADRPRGGRPCGAAEPSRAHEGVDVTGPRAAQPDRGRGNQRRGRRAGGRARVVRHLSPEQGARHG
jgi:choline dehydrogenase-like flavoprotein